MPTTFFDWIYTASATVLAVAVVLAGGLTYLTLRYTREFQRLFEKSSPALLAPDCPRPADDRPVTFETSDGRRLVGSHFHHRAKRRVGVILFCHEFTGNRWLFQPYADHLRDDGFDIFTFDYSNHGESETIDGYRLQQWVTEHEVEDVLAAIAYLSEHLDPPVDGIGLFGVSKGGSSGIVAAARDSRIKAVVTDGAFPTHSIVADYVERWVPLVVPLGNMLRFLPRWVHVLIARVEISRIERRRGCRYPHVETSFCDLTSKPFLLIHGQRDNYIRAEMIRGIFRPNQQPEEIWVVKGAKHNQAVEVATEEYHRRVRDFFLGHLGKGG